MTFRFCYQLSELLSDPRFSSDKIYHYTSQDPFKRANAAYLMGAYQVIVLQRSASKSWEKFSSASPFSAFRDASEGASYHDCTILNCLRGLERAIKLNWFSFDTFDLDFYESHDKVETGDMTWIIPSKLLAFSCPSIKEEDGWGNYTPETYVEVFKKIGVTAVIRLNHATYESSRFTSKGIRHYELYFPDGSCPSTDIVERFNKIVDMEYGAVAVHCKAGLGRTGTLIGTYAIRKFNFNAADFIAWCRICRPGSVVGPQQQFLIDYEREKDGVRMGRNGYSSFSIEAGEERFKAIYGDNGQASRLVSAKKNFETPPNKKKPQEFERNSSPVALAKSSFYNYNHYG